MRHLRVHLEPMAGDIVEHRGKEEDSVVWEKGADDANHDSSSATVSDHIKDSSIVRS